MYTLANNEEVTVHVRLTPTAESHRADCKNHIHIGEPFDDEFASEKGGHLPDKHHIPLYCSRPHGQGSVDEVDESNYPSHNKPTSFADKNCHSSNETVSFSSVSPGLSSPRIHPI
jgi:hypothetical protein